MSALSCCGLKRVPDTWGLAATAPSRSSRCAPQGVFAGRLLRHEHLHRLAVVQSNLQQILQRHQLAGHAPAAAASVASGAAMMMMM